MTPRSLFLTGTDTGVGKTYAAAHLIRAWRARGIDAVGMKPICCGDRTDAEQLHEASDRCAALNDINPVWLRTPAAPYTAAMIENRVIDLAQIKAAFARLSSAHAVVIVEGVGGWLVPITRDYFVSDLAADFGLPVAVVVANRLGTLNHTLLTIRAVRDYGKIECAGLIFNNADVPLDGSASVATATNRSVLESLVDCPILVEIGHGERA